MALSPQKLTAKERSGKPSVISATRIKKSFSGVEVLHGVDFDLKQGEIHGLAGANGAGKSTLMKILSGVHGFDSGEILIHGHPATFANPLEAGAAGIAMVYQEFSLIPTMTVAQNIFLGREPCRKGKWVDDKTCRRRASELFSTLGVGIDPKETVENLSVGNRQIVEIAKALSQNASILILDEPTASLSHTEIESLFKIITALRDQGISIIIVTHHLQELLAICDWITVLRDGQVALSRSLLEIGLNQIIEGMIGRKIERGSNDSSPEQTLPDRNRVLLEVKNLAVKDQLLDVSFKLHAGEILGIAGVLGSGKTELFKALYGILPRKAGEIRMGGKAVQIRHPADAQALGMNLVPEDRHRNGIIEGQPLRMNMLLSVWKQLSRGSYINDKMGKVKAQELIDKLKIKTAHMDQKVEHLSGGNQQKAVIAKNIAGDPDILLLDDPGVGVDVGSKLEIKEAILNLAREQKGVLLVSSEFEDLADMCHRVLIMRKGSITGEFDPSRGDTLTESALLEAAQENSVAV